jgi:hypothetical protein
MSQGKARRVPKTAFRTFSHTIRQVEVYLSRHHDFAAAQAQIGQIIIVVYPKADALRHRFSFAGRA